MERLPRRRSPRRNQPLQRNKRFELVYFRVPWGAVLIRWDVSVFTLVTLRNGSLIVESPFMPATRGEKSQILEPSFCVTKFRQKRLRRRSVVRNDTFGPALFHQCFDDSEPFVIEWLPANRLRRPTIPVSSVVLIAFLAMQVGMHPRTIGAFVLLRRFVCSRPIALAVPPQSCEGRCESGWRLGRGE